MGEKFKYKRVLLKLSGEALSGPGGVGIDFDKIASVGEQVKKLVDAGVQTAIVIGGGNFWRGRSSGSMDRTRADQMGMLATAINSLAIADTFESIGLKTVVQTGLKMPDVAEAFSKFAAVEHLEAGEVVVFGCGTGHPFFSTDTAAALRAAEIEADVILLAKNVDGVYSADPDVDKNAYKFDELKYSEVVEKGLKVMDLTAVTLCMDTSIPILVFGLNEPENIIKAAKGEKTGTYVGN